MVQPLAADAERQIIDVALHEGLMAIEIRARVAAARIDVVPETAVVALLEAHPASQRIRRSDGQAIGETAVDLHL